MNNKFLLAVDSGKSSTKAIFREETIHKVKFPTRVESVSDFGAEISPGSYLVEINGSSYLIGSMIDESKANYNLSKHTEEHRICTYLAIVKLLQHSKRSIGFAEIILALNIPLSLYKNETQKKSYHDYVRNNGEAISLTVNGKPYVFRISTLLLLPEGVANVYSDVNTYRNKKSVIIDIGSLNINFLTFENLIPLYNVMLTNDAGTNILRSKIADKLSSNYAITIGDNNAERIFADKYLVIDGVKQEDSKKIIDDLIKEHVKEIFNYARSRKISFYNASIFFSGGGSILLKEYILKEFAGATFVPDAQYANVNSFLRILEAKHG